jgi:hypothetical protein
MTELTVNRSAAIVFGAGLLVYSGFQLDTGGSLWRTGCYIGVCLGLIWFGPALGRYTGPFGSRDVDQTTPGILVIIMAWTS